MQAGRNRLQHQLARTSGSRSPTCIQSAGVHKHVAPDEVDSDRARRPRGSVPCHQRVMEVLLPRLPETGSSGVTADCACATWPPQGRPER